jgi:sialidase-1
MQPYRRLLSPVQFTCGAGCRPERQGLVAHAAIWNRATGRILRGLTLFTAIVAGSGVASAEPRQMPSVEVFSAGVGYPNYRIPSFTAMPNGTLIAIAEGRTGDDPGFGGDIDLVARRSFDGGATWGSMQLIESFGGGTLSNPTTVLDQSNNRLWMLYNRWEGSLGTSDSQPGTTNNTAWARYTDDNGQTWSSAIDITMGVKDFNNWNTVSFGPGSGIQASNGRLIIPSARWQNGWNTYAVYSDDHGTNWQRGQLTPGGNISNENQLVELADGRIQMEARPNTGIQGPRVVTTSSNGGQTWSAASAGQNWPDVQAAIERLTRQSAGDDLNRIIATGPRGPSRTDLVVRTSYDEAATYTRQRLIHDGYSGYSDIDVLNDGTVGVLFETNQARTIMFTRFNREFIEPPVGLLAYDGFRYESGTALGNKNGGYGFAGAWSGSAGGGGSSNARIEQSDLHYTNFPFTTEGQRRGWFQRGGSMARTFATPLDLDENQTYYLSLLLRQDSDSFDTENSTEALDISLLSGATEILGLGVNGNESFYIDFSGQVQSTTANALAKDSVYYLVAKIVAGDGSLGNFDQVFLKYFASGSMVPETDAGMSWTLAGSTGGNSALALDGLFIQGGSNADWLVDELRVGTSFGDVVSNVPEPSGVFAALAGVLAAGRRRRSN